jgi:hypothetical protein
VAQRQLRTVLAEFLRSLQDCRRLSLDAYRWSTPGAQPHISRNRRDNMTEMAFLRAFLAWEVFVEESFVLYLAGQRAPRGRALRRHAFPPNLKTAMEWVIPEGRTYASWTIPAHVTNRAERFFRGGLPYAPVLRANQHLLEEARIIRNAIAHRSMSARDKFENLVRTKLGFLPPNTTVGSFLGTTVPGTVPPVSFFEYFTGNIHFAARRIVPT